MPGGVFGGVHSEGSCSQDGLDSGRLVLRESGSGDSDGHMPGNRHSQKHLFRGHTESRGSRSWALWSRGFLISTAWVQVGAA